MPGVIAGLVLAFARSLGEFGAAITLAGSIPGETRTLPIAIYGATQVPDGDAEAMRLTIVSVVISMAALVASEAIDRHLRRRAGR
jgi:molybdate transport system permease protein